MQELQDRCLFKGDCSEGEDLLVKDVAEWLGLLDGVALLVFMGFGIYFRNWRIPRVVRAFDLTSLTPADYTLCVPVLPRKLNGGKESQEHQEYEERLKNHFLSVCKNMEPPIDDDEAVSKVSLVREYEGAISKFMQQGEHLQELGNAKALKEKYGAEKKDKKVVKQDKAISKLEAKIESTHKTLNSHAEISEKSRDVCMAYVTFKKTDYTDRVLDEYRFARIPMFRCCQSEKLRFEGCTINVVPASEPSDLYWENLDYNPYKRFARKSLICLLSQLHHVRSATVGILEGPLKRDR